MESANTIPVERTAGEEAFTAFFGFEPPMNLRFEDSGAGGLAVRYARVKLPVRQTSPNVETSVATDIGKPQAVASA